MKINNATPNLIKQNQMTFSANLPEKATSVIKELPRSGFSKLFELERKGSMGRTLFLVNCFIFLLGGRLLGSRDRNEARETLTRDVPTFIVVAMSIPVIKELIAKKMQTKTGFALVQDGEANLYHKLSGAKPKEVIGYNQLQDLYVYNENLGSGFEGFTKRLSDLGGNLKKIFSNLDEQIKPRLAKFSDNNDKFISELSQNNELKKLIITKFQQGSNKALEKAAFKNTIPTLIGFGITLSLIGIFIPKFNIFMTARINKQEAMEKAVKEKAAQKQTENLKAQQIK